MSRISRMVAESKLAPIAAFPLRLAAVGGYNVRQIGASARWLVNSREHTNYTFNLTPLNREHLAWFIANVTGLSVAEMRGYFREIEEDERLRNVVEIATVRSARRRLADPVPKWHKRLGWYALVRSMKPDHVVETGTDKGLGSLVFAAALLRNESGRLTTIDTNPESGYLIHGEYADVIDRRIGSSIDVINELSNVEMFLHDSLHTFEYETAEFECIAPRLTPRAVILSDNSDVTAALPNWAEKTGRRFAYFHERPADHWFPGGGIGVAW